MCDYSPRADLATDAAPRVATVLTNAERIAVSAVVHSSYYMPDVFAVVEKIIEDRLAPTGPTPT